LVNSDTKIAALFASVDLARQQKMILQSVSLIIENLDQLDSVFNGESASRIISLHKHMGIDDKLVTLWQDSFIETVAEFDNAFDSLTANAWENVLNEYTKRFKAEINKA
jgi:hypothetical protein